MNAIKFIKDHGVDKAREVVGGAPEGATHIRDSYGFIAYLKDGERKEWYYENTWVMALSWHPDCLLPDLKRLVESVGLINSVGGLTIAKKITFQKRLRNEKATHFIQHPENQKLIQLFVRNQSKPEAAIKFDLFEQAIADYEAIGGEHV